MFKNIPRQIFLQYGQSIKKQIHFIYNELLSQRAMLSSVMIKVNQFYTCKAEQIKYIKQLIKTSPSCPCEKVQVKIEF